MSPSECVEFLQELARDYQAEGDGCEQSGDIEDRDHWWDLAARFRISAKYVFAFGQEFGEGIAVPLEALAPPSASEVSPGVSEEAQ